MSQTLIVIFFNKHLITQLQQQEQLARNAVAVAAAPLTAQLIDMCFVLAIYKDRAKFNTSCCKESQLSTVNYDWRQLELHGPLALMTASVGDSGSFFYAP